MSEMAAKARREEERDADAMIEQGLRGMYEKTVSDEEFCEMCLEVAGRDAGALRAYSKKDKHKSKLIHLLVMQNRPHSIRGLSPYLDINEARSSDQCTPLHVSKWTNKAEVTELLLELGADPSLRNSYGECTLDLAETVQQRGNIAFLDLELTDLPSAPGQDGRGPEILEVALIVTDKDLNEIERGHWLVKHEHLTLSPWCTEAFKDTSEGGNNLLSELQEGVPMLQAAEELLTLLKRHCPPGICPLAGNSVHCDREVLKERIRPVYDHMSHQIIDVTTLLLLCNRWGIKHWKEGDTATAHRAMGDVERSVSTLLFLRETAFH
mmetsp:Transcript_5160/g.11422  ORF Transcript_5160/g.11422 Transcript_5160/m.11422 type:complete len:323 (+) Transcript_5160:94-1062(+)